MEDMSDHKPSQIRDAERILSQLLDVCAQNGATAADVSLGHSQDTRVEVQKGQLDTLERSESIGVSLRCFVGQRQAHVSGSDVSEAALADLADRCVAMAKVVPEDQYCGLADASELATELPELDLDGDPEPDSSVLEADALAAEEAALAVSGVDHVSGSGSSWGRSERWVAASNGFYATRRSGYSSLGLAAIARSGEAMERDYDSQVVRRIEDRRSAIEIGRTAGERAIARLNPKKVKTQTAAVIYDRRVSSSLLGPLMSAMSGPAVARGISFLKDRLGDQLFRPDVAIIDDPFRHRGLGNRAHDGEGRPVDRVALIDQGYLKNWMLNGSSAKQLGLKPNGYASGGFGSPPGVGGSNIYMQAGVKTPEQLMAAAGHGLLVSDMFGPSINPNTGDYSVGVSGFWFADGEIQYPVSEVTIAGDLISIYERLIPASDLEFRGTTDAPSILVEDMSIAGE